MEDKKTCSKCGVEKEFSEFHKSITYKYGINAKCKKCITKKDKEYHKTNKIKRNLQSSEYYKENREACKSQQLKYRNSRIEELKEYRKTIKDIIWKITKQK